MAKKRFSIQLKIVIAMLAAGLLPGLVGVFYTYLTATGALKNSIGTNFQAIAEDTAEKIDIIINREIFHAKSAAMLLSEDMMSGNQTYMSDHIERHFRQHSIDISAIGVTDQHGNVKVYRVTPDNLKQPVEALSKRIDMAGSEEAWIGIIRPDEMSEQYFMFITVPIPDGQGGHIGNILVLYRVSEIFSVINNVNIGQTGHANLITSDGILLVCPVTGSAGHTINEDLLKQVTATRAGWVVAPDDAHGGKNAIIGFAPVDTAIQMSGINSGSTGWHVFIRQLPDETYAPIYSMLWRISILGFMLVCILALIGFLAARRIVQPIRLLSEGAHLIGKGRLRHQIHIKTGDEIEELAEIFNQMARDLKERFLEIQLERQKLLHSERLSALSHFSSAFAHDLRNPIIAIKKTLEMLKDSYTPASETTIQNIYADLISTCGLLLGLVNDVLDVHQVSYRELPLLYSSFSLNEALNEVTQLLHIEADERRVRVDLDTSDQEIWIEGDRRRIQRVFINLLGNAVKHSPPGGTIRMSIKTNSDQLLFRIEDEGPGIPSDALPRIFEIFYRSDKNGVKSGTGMGLYFCKVVIEAHGGRIMAENKASGGAIFSVELPLTRRKPDVYQDTHSR